MSKHAEDDFIMALPPYIARAELLSGEAGRAWDERVKRMNACTATADDRRIHQLAVSALSHGKALPAEAKLMPKEPPTTAMFKEDVLDQVETALSYGIPPLIVERIVAGDVSPTASTRECKRVVSGELRLLVLAGERGHGKSYAAADWLWRGPHQTPPVLRKQLCKRRMIAADELDVLDKWEQNQAAMSSALVIDDAGTEREHLVELVALLIVRRYRSGLATIVTTNLNLPAFSRKYGARVEDRIHEVGDFVIVGEDPTKSLRRK